MYRYDYFGQEWTHTCRACGTELYAPTRKHLEGNHWIHTHSSQCLGGW